MDHDAEQAHSSSAHSVFICKIEKSTTTRRSTSTTTRRSTSRMWFQTTRSKLAARREKQGAMKKKIQKTSSEQQEATTRSTIEEKSLALVRRIYDCFDEQPGLVETYLSDDADVFFQAALMNRHDFVDQPRLLCVKAPPRSQVQWNPL